jgi:hypothetical protein
MKSQDIRIERDADTAIDEKSYQHSEDSRDKKADEQNYIPNFPVLKQCEALFLYQKPAYTISSQSDCGYQEKIIFSGHNFRFKKL